MSDPTPTPRWPSDKNHGLLPCPCGSTDLFVVARDRETIWTVECCVCARRGRDKPTREQARADWGIIAPPTAAPLRLPDPTLDRPLLDGWAGGAGWPSDDDDADYPGTSIGFRGDE